KGTNKAGEEAEKHVSIGNEVATEAFEHDLSAPYRGNVDAYNDHWHHVALVFKNGQMKVYEDQYRVLVMPEVGDFVPKTLDFGGIGDNDKPIVFKNVRVATGGGMNLIDKLTKDGRIITHGILFDTNLATIKAESMGTISQIAKLLKDNPDVKLEIGGHTD